MNRQWRAFGWLTAGTATVLTAALVVASAQLVVMARASSALAAGPGVAAWRFATPAAIATDLAARPEHCGAPVVDADGRVVGLLIARAPFIESLILPGSEMRAAVEVMRKSATARN